MKTRANPNPGSGDSLRDRAADLLSSKYGRAQTEKRASGKKVDVYFEHRELGKVSRIYVEAKDYDKPLGRSAVRDILSDYGGILRLNEPSILLIVTRSGLSADAQSFIEDENSCLRHQTIWEVETGLIDLENYLRYLIDELTSSGLEKYYIESGFSHRKSKDPSHRAHETKTGNRFDSEKSTFSELLEWGTDDGDNTPVAVLGGYGSGKTSLATKLASEYSKRALYDPKARQPILIRLGGISQYSNLEGLLGGFFTHDFPLPNFNGHNFLSLNKKGRFIIILDGFDEMKHSMSWADFKLQVENLLKLHPGNSRILLLGRPSAFLSDQEDRYILKGEKPVGDNWVKLPHWPRFHELELNDFTKMERQKFISNYLTFASERSDSSFIEERTRLVNEIADLDTELFRKPVHSKILTDLATDPNFDLKRFKEESSRWTLYKEFVESLYDRETSKVTRKDISSERRIRFLRELAFWLWSEQGTKISFSATELPRNLFNGLHMDDAEDYLSLSRELLVGSILERKAGEIFFFGHRSFAEYLVADRMLRTPPTSSEHELYSGAFVDGVREFVVDAGRLESVKEWAETFDGANGVISMAYINFLGNACGGMANLHQRLHSNSRWKEILAPYARNLLSTKETTKRFSHLFLPLVQWLSHGTTYG